MPARKKAKPKRRKAPAKRPAARKKTAKKPAKKAPARRAAPKARKPAPRPAARPVPVSMAPPGERIGVVTHYYSHLAVAVVKLESARLRVGDTIHFRGHTTDFKQRVDSLQVNHAPVQEVGPGDDFGLKVREHAREHDIVYKVA
ncbi:MAG TPA: EF-Tu/IF-2/RF-3 family GTPase [Burkholderiales bacterium]|nr:EF-Tu/IF-2/RF-3 family GTPase [Burkholderiales bacterium]